MLDVEQSVLGIMIERTSDDGHLELLAQPMQAPATALCTTTQNMLQSLQVNDEQAFKQKTVEFIKKFSYRGQRFPSALLLHTSTREFLCTILLLVATIKRRCIYCMPARYDHIQTHVRPNPKVRARPVFGSLQAFFAACFPAEHSGVMPARSIKEECQHLAICVQHA